MMISMQIHLIFQSFYNWWKIWTETSEGSAADQLSGNVNYLPGMGGFLQSIIYGFAGVRIRPEMLEFHNPMVPPGAASLKMIGFHYLGANMTIEITTERVVIVVHSEADHPLRLRRNDTQGREENLPPGNYSLPHQLSSSFFFRCDWIFTKWQQNSHWHIKKHP